MGTVCLSERDVRLVLGAAAECQEAHPQVGSVSDLLDCLASIVRCDVVFWNSYGLRPELEERALVSSSLVRPVVRAPVGPWLEHLSEHPIMSGLHGPVTAISDVLSTAQFARTWLFQEVFTPVGLRYELGLELPHACDEMNVVVFSRAPGRDFSDRDHLVLELLRPHVDAALRRLTGPASPLTPRQAEVLGLAGQGLSDAQIASRLGLSRRTVGKHLENVYSLTGAHSRLQAVSLGAGR